MASPFEYTNVAPYAALGAEQLLVQSRRNPLQEMIAAYEAPRIAQQKALSEQLAIDIQRANLQATQRAMDPNDPANKLKMAIDQAKLAELQRDPNIAFQRSLQEDALKGIIAGRNPNLIIEPTIDPAILASRAEAEAAGGIPSTSYEKSDFVPLIPAGRGFPAMGTSESAGEAALARRQKNLIDLAKERVNASSSVRGLTPNARLDLARRVGKTGTPIDRVDPNLLQTPQELAAYQAGLVEREEGFNLKPTGEEAKSFRMTTDVSKAINSTIDKIDEFKETGTFPGIGQTVVNQFLSTRADQISGLGFIPGGQAVYSGFQRLVRDAQTPESRELEMRRALITSTILRAQAGLAQTGIELSNLVPYTPQISDSEESLTDKLNFLKALSDQQIDTFGELYPALRKSRLKGDRPGTPSDEASSDMIKIIHSDGRSGEIPSNQLEGALKAGFKRK